MMAMLGGILAASALPTAQTKPGKPDPIDYNRDIRPILSENCSACHGQDGNKRQAGLRLDTAAGATAKLPSGKWAIMPGKPAASELITRISAKSPLLMPPANSGKHLSATQIALLQRWVAQGAQYAEHWSYTAVKRPNSPAPVTTGKEAAAWKWARNPIDRFVLSRLLKEGLHPSPSADRPTLIRRLSLDLTGLPPTAEEVTAFVNDKSPEAYSKVVDHLLASPHYGERMAAYWLDLVRYADTDGYHGDRHRNVFPYRDYVIQAFNSNMPFDRFTTEQIAGDLLPNATMEQKIASGYNRLNMVTREGGSQAKEYLAKYASERVRTTSLVWQGATLGCAECHDHKFDPYTTKDFYRFSAFFADIKQVGVYDNGKADLDPSMPVPSPEQSSELAKLDGKISTLKAEIATPTPALAESQAKWEQSVRNNVTQWTVLKPETMAAKSGASLTPQSDGSILAGGKQAETETYTLTFNANLKGISAFRIEVLPDKSLPASGPGRAGNGNFVLTGVKVTPGGSAQPILLQNPSATFEQKFGAEGNPGGLFSAALAIATPKLNPNHGWAIMEQAGKENHAVFETASNLGDGPFTITLDQTYPGHAVGRFRISATTSPRPIRAGVSGLPGSIAPILQIEAAKRTPEQQTAIAAYYRTIAPELQPQRTALAETEKRRAQLNMEIPSMLVTESVAPAITRVLPRGNWMDDSGEVVQPGVPHFLPQMASSQPANRLALAKWLTSKQNPLTARVLVNRLWKLLYGEGIARSTGDFGSQGAWPTHPELLDWLASELMDSGWDVKHIVKLMVTSNTYRQTSHTPKDLLNKDPYNHLLARQARFRLDAEFVRDNALAISGALSEKIGGRSVKPYQPDGYWDLCNTFAGRLIYDQDHNEDLYRRGIYTYWKRTFLHPSMLAFDAPIREECTVERPRSNTPLQALVLLNDPTYVEAARLFAEHIIREGGPNTASKINWAFRRAISRNAKPQEITVLTGLLNKHMGQYTSDAPDAAKFISAGEKPASKGLSAPELAAWTSVARTILNLHETVTRE
jgi:mono/diheme cytochrome c family protein